MQDKAEAPCQHRALLIDTKAEWPDKFLCATCGVYVRGDDLPEGWIKDYWKDAKEAWGGR